MTVQPLRGLAALSENMRCLPSTDFGGTPPSVPSPVLGNPTPSSDVPVQRVCTGHT